jgi:hypothetical protein
VPAARQQWRRGVQGEVGEEEGEAVEGQLEVAKKLAM